MDKAQNWQAGFRSKVFGYGVYQSIQGLNLSSISFIKDSTAGAPHTVEPLQCGRQERQIEAQ
jgi:hypothetical protein